jgi:hypothetical protein
MESKKQEFIVYTPKKNTGPSPEQLIKEFRKGVSIQELSEKHGKGIESIRALMMKAPEAYREAREFVNKKKFESNYAEFEKLIKRLDRIPTRGETFEHSEALERHYRALRESAEKEGYRYERKKVKTYYDRAKHQEYMLSHLQKLAKKLNHVPSRKELFFAGEFHFINYELHFTSYENALKLAGLTEEK